MREKPEHIRKQYAFLVSLGITGVIFLFWLASFRIQSTQVADVSPVKVQSPISSLTASAGDAFTYVKELIFGANKAQYSSDNIEVVPGKI